MMWSGGPQDTLNQSLSHLGHLKEEDRVHHGVSATCTVTVSENNTLGR